MTTFHLRTEHVLQGSFSIKSLNLILIFQMNCPSCFLYALPLASKLHEQYSDRINILGLSTAFEDFEINTAHHTQQLLQSGAMVGVTQTYFQQRQIQQYAVPLKFPMAFDRETFYLNSLLGTPSWIVFDHEYHILDSWFGHQSKEEVERRLNTYLSRSIYPSRSMERECL